MASRFHFFILHPSSFLLLLALLLASACKGPLVSEGDTAPTRYPVAGVDARNLREKPRRRPVGVGDPVPMLVLLDQKGREVSTGELVAGGDAVIIFLPGLESAAARPVYPWVRRNRELIASRRAEILLISPEPPEANDAVATREELRIAVLHDPSGWGARAFGLLTSPTATAVDQPWSILIGKEGAVFSAKTGLYDVTDVITTLTVRPTNPDDFRAFDLLKK